METVQHYIGVIRRWWVLILVGALLGSVGAYGLTVRMTPMYRSTSLLIVDNVEDPVAPNYQDVQMNQRLTDTYAERLTSRSVLEAVANELGLGIGPGQLRGQITATPLLNTSLVRLSVVDSDPARAVAIANKIPEVFNAHNDSLQQAQFADLRARYTEQLAAINGDIRNTQAQIRQIGEASSAENQVLLEQLQANLSSYRSNYAALLDKYGELRLAEAGRRASLTVDQPATLPRSPFSPNVQRNTILGGLAGLAIVLVVATVLSYLDDTVRTQDDLPKAISSDHINTPPAVRALNGNGIAAPTFLVAHDSASTELVRYLMRLVQYNEFGAVRVVTSLLFANATGNGDSSRLIADVATTMAQSGRSTLVIDADMEHPTLHAAFGIQQNRGLADVLRDSKSAGMGRIEEYLIKTVNSNLKVLLAGEQQSDDAFELGELGQVLSRAGHDVDVVLVKGPAVLDDPRSTFLARQADGVVLIADAGQTRRRDIAESVRRLEQADARVLGTLLYRPSGDVSTKTPSYNVSS